MPPPKTETTSYSTIVLKSLRWPGAATVYQNGKWQSIYIGYGQPRAGDSFNPIGPPTILAEPEDLDEMPEPNPAKAPEPAPAAPAENAENAEAKQE